MPLDAYRADISPEVMVAELNTAAEHQSATEILRTAVQKVPRIALVSSFGAESVALLHLCATIDRSLPVIFIDTEMLFAETLAYQQDVAALLGLTNLHIVRPKSAQRQDPTGSLHKADPNKCCSLRKTQPLAQALAGHGGWITGRKRFQSGTRAALDPFEIEPGTGRIKVNPLAHWQSRDVSDYITNHNLPRHPLVAKGFPSIGCAPCTSPVKHGEDTRAGRWRATDKQECGIHFSGGRAIRTGDHP